MRSSDNNKKMLPSNITDAILTVYDSGVEKPSGILAALMRQYPMLSIATINSVLSTFRAKKKEKPEEKEKPKTKAEQLSDYLEKRCRACPYYSGQKVCVFPESMCVFPDQKAEGERLKQMMAEENEEVKKKREAKKKADEENKKQTREKVREQKERIADPFAELEAELDELILQKESEEQEAPAADEDMDMIDEEILLGLKPMDRYFDVTEYVHVPPKMSDELFLEDFKDILK